MVVLFFIFIFAWFAVMHMEVRLYLCFKAMLVHPFVYSCSLVGYVYGSSFMYTLLENRLWWHNFISCSGKISEEI